MVAFITIIGPCSRFLSCMIHMILLRHVSFFCLIPVTELYMRQFYDYTSQLSLYLTYWHMYINIFLLIKELSIQPYLYRRMGMDEACCRTYPPTGIEAHTHLTGAYPDTRSYSVSSAAGSPAAGGTVQHLEPVHPRPADSLQAPPSDQRTGTSRTIVRITACVNTHDTHPGITIMRTIFHVILLAYANNIFLWYVIVFFVHIIYVNMNNIVLL